MGFPRFWLKVALAAGVVAVADFALFDARGLGANVGVVLSAATLALALANPAIWRSRAATVAFLLGVPLALLPFERPSFVGFLLWALAMAVAALAPRAPRGEDGWRWAQRLVVAGVKSLIGPPWDLRKALKARARSKPVKLAAIALAVALPVAGGLTFLTLFTAANPVLSRALGGWELPAFEPGRVVFWAVIGLPLWALLRPRGPRRTMRTPGLDGDLDLPGVTATSVTASLMVFNLVFLLQNGLDIAYLWSGAGLPKGVSFADYAHQGAYPLIATALLAGLFVLVFLRPGSATAAKPAVRWLVTAWVGQNLFLVASTILRTADYIEAYSLTRLRIAALLWMGVVAVGLALILWRVLRGRSSGWLINANLAVLGAVLSACSLADFSAITADWNVRHAREVGGEGVVLDLCYMRSLKGGAVVPLARLEAQPLPPALRERVVNVRRELASDLVRDHSAWRVWRWRDARRLERLAALGLPGVRLDGPSFNDVNREALPPQIRSECDGSPRARPPLPNNPPLTPSANPRT